MDVGSKVVGGIVQLECKMVMVMEGTLTGMIGIAFSTSPVNKILLHKMYSLYLSN